MKRSGRNRSYASSRRNDNDDDERGYKKRKGPAPVIISSTPSISLMTESSSVNIGLLIGDADDDDLDEEMPASFRKGTVSVTTPSERTSTHDSHSSVSSSPTTSSPAAPVVVNSKPTLSEASIQIVKHADDIERALSWLASTGKPWSVTENSLLFTDRELSSIESKMTQCWRQFAATVKNILQSKQMASDIEMGNIVDQVYREFVCRSNQQEQIQPPCWAIVGPSGIGKRSLLESLFSTPSSSKSGNNLVPVVWDISKLASFTIDAIKTSLTELVNTNSFAEEICLLRTRRSFGGRSSSPKSFHLWRPIIINDLDHLMDMKHFTTQEKNDLFAFLIDFFTVVVPRLVPAPLRDLEEDFLSPPVAEHRTRPLIIVVVESRHSFQTRDWLRQCFGGAYITVTGRTSEDPSRSPPRPPQRLVGSESTSRTVYLGAKLSCSRMRSWLKTLRCRLTDIQWASRFKSCNMPRLAVVSKPFLEHFFDSCASRMIGAPCPMGSWQRQVDFCLIPFHSTWSSRDLASSRQVGETSVIEEAFDDGVPLDYKADLDSIVIQSDSSLGAVTHAWSRALSSSTFGHVLEQVHFRIERAIASTNNLTRTPPAKPVLPLAEMSRFDALRANFINQLDLFGRDDVLRPYIERALSSFVKTLGDKSRDVTSRQAALENEKSPVSGFWTRSQLLKSIGTSLVPDGQFPELGRSNRGAIRDQIDTYIDYPSLLIKDAEIF